MPDGTVQDFEPHRRRLTGLAYRMLGSVAEAEDVVQDAWLRWHHADREGVRDSGAFLRRVVARLCLDRLKSARARRETYIGPWLPEPVLDIEALRAPPAGEWADDLSFALMLTLERLSPLERAAFLLHDVFDMDFGEIATTLDRSEAACRQLAARARAHVRAARPRFTIPAEQGERLVTAFLGAVQNGDTATLARLLAEDAVLHTDGGGRRAAARNPIRGRDHILRMYAGLARKSRLPRMEAMVHPLRINGLPGIIAIEPDGAMQAIAFEIAEERISAIYVVSNPDKLRHLASLMR
ncbi:MAG TPA: sigma-70 family RNA polymerase sigma factor [Acetobacteraceae bacterium]|nr:sigma-70 family RNA polymerase sigma factor [Acetobacteraceae bacterium]